MIRKGCLISELRISFFMLWISLICIVDLNCFASYSNLSYNFF